MGRDDYMIICGDFGGVWSDTPKEEYWLNWLEEKPWTTLWVDGNHENFSMLNTFPVHQWNGGKVHYARPHVIHLMRGQVFEIGGLTWFTMGGAQSHDIEDGILDPAAPDFRDRLDSLKRAGRRRFRVLSKSWWPEELSSNAEYEEAMDNLERAGWCVDCVLTHCAPTSITLTMDRHNEADRLTDFLEMVKSRCQFAYWFFGHHHRNEIIDEKYILQWEQISQIL